MIIILPAIILFVFLWVGLIIWGFIGLVYAAYRFIKFTYRAFLHVGSSVKHRIYG